MRTFVALLVIIYLGGVGVMLGPTFSAGWNTGTPAELFGNVIAELPRAMLWPAVLYHSIMGSSQDKV